MKNLIVIFTLAAILLSGCSGVSNTKVMDYANTYIEHFKKSDFAAMYGMFYEKAAAEIPYSNYESMHKNIIERLGAVKEIKNGRLVGANYSLGGNTYEIVYDVDFERDKGLYGVKVLSSGNKLYIVGWYIESKGLI